MPRPLVPVIVILAGLAPAREEATRPEPHAVSRSQVWHGRLTKRAEYTLTIRPDLTLRMDEAEFNRGEPRMDLVWEGTLDPANGHIHVTHAPSGSTRDWGLCLGTPYSVLIIDEYTIVRLWERK